MLLIIVPARGGSKGLPRKNALTLGDLPLLGWTAEAIRQSGLRDCFSLLSTDDPEIARLGEKVGMNVPFLRPGHLAEDASSAESVAIHALNWFAQEQNQDAFAVLLLQPTSPFRPPEIIKHAVTLLEKKDFLQGVLGVKPIYRTPATLFHMDSQEMLTPLKSAKNGDQRRQAADPLYTPNGALYLVRSQVLRDQNTFFPLKCQALVMDSISSIDIDEPIDFELAQAVAGSGLTWRG